DGCLGVGVGRDVAPDREGVLSGEASGLLGVLEFDVDAGDFGAGLGEGDRDGAADAAAGAADDGGLAFEGVGVGHGNRGLSLIMVTFFPSRLPSRARRA